MFQEVVRDNEVEGGVGDRPKPLAIVEDVDLNERLVLELGIVGPEL